MIVLLKMCTAGNIFEKIRLKSIRNLQPRDDGQVGILKEKADPVFWWGTKEGDIQQKGRIFDILGMRGEPPCSPSVANHVEC